jgi:hypothetical protein
MSPTLASCAACGYTFTEREALDPCPACGSTERTLVRESLVVDRSQEDRVIKAHRVEQRQPDGSCEVVEAPEPDSAL